ncbi:hypothetical protein [Enterobacter kobei]|uniref:hypothetical protein n=1 Tax=Enterobacter kobei TaxID=208224 RepID=UPI000795C2A4|nr:hypothetical protein [Enterobacter kobei]SAF46361.1 Uncharacterised protein [Enterobacter kobei]
MSEEKDFEQSANDVRNAVLNRLKQTLNQHRQLADSEHSSCPAPTPEESDSSDSSSASSTVLNEPETENDIEKLKTNVRIVSGPKALSHVVENVRKRKAHVAGKQKETPVLISRPRGDGGEPGRLAIAASIKRDLETKTGPGDRVQTSLPTAFQVNALDSERQRLNNRDFEEEIKLKKSYGKWFLIILACQLLVMNGVFILDGWKVLNFEDLTLQLYMGGTLTEVFGLVLVVTKYLFKRK